MLSFFVSLALFFVRPVCRKQQISALYFVIYIYFCSYNSRLAAPLDFCPVESTAHLRKASMAQPTLIDIDRILANKMGTKSRFVPGFLVRYLKNIVHQDWLNEFIAQEGEIQGVQWLEDCIRHLGLQIEVEGKENLPSDADGRRFTFVSNHPLGGADGVVLGAILGRHYDERVCYLANDLLMNLSGLAPLIVPINKTGREGRGLLQRVSAAFAGDKHIIMFPAGLCSRRIDGKIQDIAWAKTFVTKSVESQRDIVPIYFEGRNSDRFYRLANWSKRLGIRFNLAMLFLVDELYRHRGGKFRVVIGKPIPWQEFTSARTPLAWAAHVRELVYRLAR